MIFILAALALVLAILTGVVIGRDGLGANHPPRSHHPDQFTRSQWP